MSPTRIALAAVFISSIRSQAVFGQTPDPRIEDAIAEIKLLTRVVAEQDRRLGDLEKTVKELQVISDRPLGTTAGEIPVVRGSKTSVRTSAGPAWKTPSAWGRIQKGMSRAQVVAILDKPTSVDTGLFTTLFYQGNVAGSGSVTGTVKLSDDRVLEVNVPVF